MLDVDESDQTSSSARDLQQLLRTDEEGDPTAEDTEFAEDSGSQEQGEVVEKNCQNALVKHLEACRHCLVAYSSGVEDLEKQLQELEGESIAVKESQGEEAVNLEGGPSADRRGARGSESRQVCRVLDNRTGRRAPVVQVRRGLHAQDSPRNPATRDPGSTGAVGCRPGCAGHRHRVPVGDAPDETAGGYADRRDDPGPGDGVGAAERHSTRRGGVQEVQGHHRPKWQCSGHSRPTRARGQRRRHGRRSSATRYLCPSTDGKAPGCTMGWQTCWGRTLRR
eukprot:3608190-Rhodomonas_salina.2